MCEAYFLPQIVSLPEINFCEFFRAHVGRSAPHSSAKSLLETLQCGRASWQTATA